MIHFNELYVTEDGKHLVIDAAIDDMPEYDNFYIDSIKVDTGANCQQGGQSEHAVDVYFPKTRIVGDIDGNGIINEVEVEAWQMMLDLCGLGKKIYTRSDGTHYYKAKVYNEETEEDETVEIEIKPATYNLYQAILAHSPSEFAGDTLLGHLISYIWETIGDAAFPGKGATPGDINNDGEVNVSDVTAFIDYILRVGDAQTDTPVSVTIKERHVRLCLGWGDGLSALVDKDFSKTMFIVTVTASSGTEEIVELECGQDITQIVGVAYNTKLLYDSAMKYAANYGSTCESRDADAFIDFLMRYYGFLFALKCGDLCQAQYYWSNYLTDTESVKGSLTSGGCGCHGTYG